MNKTQDVVALRVARVPAPRPATGSEAVTARNTSQDASAFTAWPAVRPGLYVRSATAEDAAGLSALIAGLSVRSAFHRFLAGVGRPSARLVGRLLRVDETHGALVALSSGRLVAHAMWVLGEDAVEVGVMVSDDWQGQGVGSELVRAALTEAAVAGGCRVRFDVHVDNRRLARRLVRWPGVTVSRDGEMLTFSAPMSASTPPAQVVQVP
jgi:GNAT superfamily N-acetyltransferase